MKNIMIIVMDTMRLDFFQKLEKKHKRFEKMGFVGLNNCIAPSPWTLPSHASMFTGLYPKDHMAHETKAIKDLDIDRIMLRVPTFVEDLNRFGYTTYGVSANPFVHPIYGFSSFKHFVTESYFTDIIGSVVEIADKTKKRVAKYKNIYGSNTLRLAAKILTEDPNLFMEAFGGALMRTPRSALKKFKARFLEGWPLEKGGMNTVKYVKNEQLRRPYFLFINLMEAHEPYTGKKETDLSGETSFLKKQPSDADVERWKVLYSKAATRAYSYAADIAKAIIERYGKDQLIIVTSDHGQAFGEHGFVGHGVFLYDEIVRVPMLAFGIKGSKTVKKGFSSLVGIKNFVLEYAERGSADLDSLIGKSVYSECFGIQHNMSVVKNIDRKKVQRNERHRKRIFR